MNLIHLISANLWDQVIKNLKNIKRNKKEQMLDIDRIYKCIYDMFRE